jgi:hypothetical protein
MPDILMDIIRHTGNLGYFDAVKISNINDEIKIESTDYNRTVVFKATLKQPIEGLIDGFGVALPGFLNFAIAKTDLTTINTITRMNINKTEALVFDDDGNSSTYRFTATNLVSDQPILKSINWDITFKPNKNKLHEIIQLANIATENKFYLTIIGNTLKLHIGNQANITLSTNIPNTIIPPNLFWNFETFISLIKLGLEENLEFKISTKGLFQISIQNDFATYNYFLVRF